MTFSKRLKELMLERRPPLTQQALAERIGVTPSAVSGWLRQDRIPYPSHLNQLCALFGVRRQWLETGNGPKSLPTISVVQEVPTAYNRRDKLSIIEDRFPESLPMLDSLLDSLLREVTRETEHEKEQSKKGDRSSNRAGPAAPV